MCFRLTFKNGIKTKDKFNSPKNNAQSIIIKESIKNLYFINNNITIDYSPIQPTPTSPLSQDLFTHKVFAP